MGSEHTRLRLIQAAERLIAERGVDGVSLREIGRAAGERNTAAVQYHFGTKDALISTIFQRRMARLDAVRVRMLDDLEADGGLPDLHALMGALVYPQLEFLLQDPDEGGTYLRFIAQVHRSSGRRVIDHAREAEAVGLLRMQARVQEHLADLPGAIGAERFALVVGYIVHAVAEHASRVQLRKAHEPPVDTVQFARTLVDTAVGLLTAPRVAVVPAAWSAGVAAR